MGNFDKKLGLARPPPLVGTKSQVYPKKLLDGSPKLREWNETDIKGGSGGGFGDEWSVFAGSLLLSWDIPFRGCTKRRNRGRVSEEQKYIRTFYLYVSKLSTEIYLIFL